LPAPVVLLIKRVVISSIILAASSHAQAGTVGALAYSVSKDFVSAVWDASSTEEANRLAMGQCHESDCKVVVVAENQFLAISTDARGHYGVGTGGTREGAIVGAYRQCKKQSAECRPTAYVSSTGSGKDLFKSINAGPSHPRLAQLGGVFEKTIPNFKGFPQLHKNWCWAAATESIYYSMTGARLDQGLLAKIHIDSSKPISSPTGFDLVETTVTDIVCRGNSTDSEDCNHSGFVQTALQKIASSIPFANYPDPSSGISVYNTIRDSLSHNIPVGITVTWYTGNAHAVVVYGAKFAAPTAGRNARITLKIYDPFDDHYYTMQSNTYFPNYEMVPGIFEGWVSLANFKSAHANEVSAKACEFMAPDEQAKFCSNLLKP
jgi:hypothetical protein